MGKYLALYLGAATEDQKNQITPAQSQKFIESWGKWAHENEKSLVDAGSPLNRKTILTANNVEDTSNKRTGYAIIEAQSHEAALDIFSTHPHLTLFPGNSIEVFECPPPPTEQTP
jgi:hypothetical protein